MILFINEMIDSMEFCTLVQLFYDVGEVFKDSDEEKTALNACYEKLY